MMFQTHRVPTTFHLGKLYYNGIIHTQKKLLSKNIFLGVVRKMIFFRQEYAKVMIYKCEYSELFIKHVLKIKICYRFYF